MTLPLEPTNGRGARDIRARVLVVEDSNVIAQLMSRLLSKVGCTVSLATSGEEALQLFAREQPDIVLLDVMLPGIDGFEVCRQLKDAPATRLTPIVLVTALDSQDDRIRGIDAGADDFLSKPCHAEELVARVGSLVRLKRYTDELERAETMVMSLARTVEARDPYTDGHCHRLADYGSRLGRQIGLPDEDVEALYRGGYLHDVGKIGIPDAVLLKPGRLTPEEFAVMQRHTKIGEHLCGNLRSLSLVRPIIQHHHERLDGRGYPQGLKGDMVPLLAQIIAVVDTYDAITTSRPYRSALPREHAFDELEADARSGALNPDLVTEFIGLMSS